MRDAVKTSSPARVGRVVVVGNPNAGKTTIFNRLTGLSQKVGNYPGVTVEKKVGRCVVDGMEVRLVDLPGTYSLAAHSPDEMVAVDVLLGHQEGEERPDLVLQVVDASNLERNLYLLCQVLELGVPVVVALNMMDVARVRGISIDAEGLASKLGIPVIPVEGHRGVGIDDLRSAMSHALSRALVETPGTAEEAPPGGALELGDALHQRVGDLHRELSPEFQRAEGRSLHEFEVLRAVIDSEGHAEMRLSSVLGDSCLEGIKKVREEVGGDVPLPVLEASIRYAWVRQKVEGHLQRAPVKTRTWTERLDSVLTHKVFGLLIFAVMMLVVFQSVFTWASPIMEMFDGVFAWVAGSVESVLPAGALRSLITDGVIAGVGMVVMFLPQILILFLFIGIFEDCGYMARGAFLMDKIMSKCGLSGKSFIPMLSGFACAVPGIMATRVIEGRKDRLATVLVTPLMSCSARLPVYAIFIGTFIPDRPVIRGVLGLQALTLFGLYALGIVVAVAMAWILRKTLLRGGRAPFVLELPSYKWPALGGVLMKLFERAKAFLVRAGTIILAIAIVVWALAYFPHSASIGETYQGERERIGRELPPGAERVTRLEEVGKLESGAYLRDSYFGRAGQYVEPVFRPLGWDWRISMAAIASFPAREVIVATLGTIYNMGGSEDEESTALRESLRDASWPSTDPLRPGLPVFNIPVALSIMVFFALCCQCGATVATIKRETNSWSWAWFAFGYMTLLAYVGAFITYQVGSMI